MKILRLIILFSGILLAAGCQNYELPALLENQDADEIEEDVEVSGDDAGDGQDQDVEDEADVDEADVEEPTCVPEIIQCSEEVCGEIEDSCGGIVHCLPCDCTFSKEERCGLQGLGVWLTCNDAGNAGAEDPPICLMPEIPEDWTEDSVFVFVDLENGDAQNPGTRELPLKTIPEGIYTAQKTEGAVAVIVASSGSEVFESELISVADGISVLGGYDSDFSYTPYNWPTLLIKKGTLPSAEPDVFGLRAESITRRTLIHGLRFRTENAAAGRSNYGVYARQIEENQLALHYVTAHAGRGGNGSDAQAGAAGNDGGNGGNALWEHRGLVGVVKPESSEPGTGGSNAACSPLVTMGGNGGVGQSKNGLAQPGSSVEGGAGGAGGVATVNNGYGWDGVSASLNVEPGEDGEGGVSAGELYEDFWQPTGHGGDGTAGEHGRGGGGGGGAAFAKGSNVAGNGGGGGGAGGCAGQGGQGGQGGGGSFGLFLVEADIEIKDSTFTAGTGGKGGNGGKGGEGGKGGTGGKGGVSSSSTAAPTPYGGKGGDGSAGGKGGDGGGGAGGVSFGVYCHKSTLTLQDGVQFVSGASAPGGTGGNPGEPGKAADSFGCD